MVLEELVERKMEGGERSRLRPGELAGLHAETRKLEAQLEPAATQSGLPDEPPNLRDVNEFLISTRLAR